MTHYLPEALSGALAVSILALVTSVIAVVLAAFPLLRRLRSARSKKIADRQAAEKAAEQAAAGQAAIAEDHVAAISAAVAATLGAHRIVRIEPAHHGIGWQAEGRAAHHGSHALSHPGTSHNQGNNHGTEVQNHSRGA